MANSEHVEVLRQGVDNWNALVREHRLHKPDLSGANLSKADLIGADFTGADLTGADLTGADLSEANLGKVILIEANLRDADLSGADLGKAILVDADLRGAHLIGANLGAANLVEADLRGADLSSACLNEADFSGADLRRANLQGASLIETELAGADLTDCQVYGISTWGITLSDQTKQQNLIVTPSHEPEITADNIEVAQFLYLLLHNEKIRDVIDTVGKKAVLILGRFTPGRKAVLDAVGNELRKHGYLPIVFDFEKPASRDTTATISILAHMARFIIADLTDPKSVPHELATVIPMTRNVPVQPIILSGENPFGMFLDMLAYPWVLVPHRYDTLGQLIADLYDRVIWPAEAKVLELRDATPKQGW